MRAIGYVRVSTDEQGQSGLGLEAQESAIRLELERRGWTLQDMVREVRSGKDMRRPELQRALARLDAHEADALVVAKLDRLSRSVKDFSDVLERAQKHRWNVRIIDLDVDTTTPVGEAVATVLATFAQLERRLIGQRTKEAMAAKRTQGATFGRPLAVPPKIRRQILDWRAAGWSYGEITRELNARKVPTGHNAEQWGRSSVQAIVARG